MFVVLGLPISLTSIFLYLFLTFFGNSIWVWISALTLSILILGFIFRNYLEDLKQVQRFFASLRMTRDGLKTLSLLSIILFFVFAKAFIISPFAFTKTTGDFKHIQITDVGDYYKHTFVVSMLKLDGIPPGHPYFPEAKLSYYFGYYLIPAAISKIFNFAPNQVFYIFTIVTDLLGILIIFRIFQKHIKTYLGKFLALFLLISGVGINVIPEILGKVNQFSTNSGFQLINNYTALLFVPQHFFAACLTLGLLHYLFFEKPKILFTGITLAFIFLSSIFVSWTMAIWLGLLFYFEKSKRTLLILAGILSLVLLIPYILGFSERGNILSIKEFQLNIFITAIFIQYGPIVTVTFLAVLLQGKSFVKKNLSLILALTIPFIVTWFIRSPIFNDFSMRGLMPIQLILPLIFVYFFENQKNKFLKIMLLIIAVLTILLGLKAFYENYSSHWKARFILHPSISQLLFEVRKIPDDARIAAIDRDRWVEFIPSLGFKKVLSPYLFDSFVYFVGEKSEEHGRYERLAIDLFIEPNVAIDLKTLIANQNEKLGRIFEFFNMYKADALLLKNQLWVKKDVNPYLAIIQKMDVRIVPFTGDFSLVDYKSLLEKLSNYEILMRDQVMVLPIKDRKFYLSEGVWYLAGCDSEKKQLVLELEDYYQLFNQKVDGSSIVCTGRIFYLQKDEELLLSEGSTVKEIFAYPIDIKPLR